MRVRNKELRSARHRKEQRIKELIKEAKEVKGKVEKAPKAPKKPAAAKPAAAPKPKRAPAKKKDEAEVVEAPQAPVEEATAE